MSPSPTDGIKKLGQSSSPDASPVEQLEALNSTGLNSSIFSQLASNQFFTAGFGLAGLAAVTRLGQNGFKRGIHMLRRRLLINMEVTRHSESYEPLLRFITLYQRQQSNQQNAPSQRFWSAVLRRLRPPLHDVQLHESRIEGPGGSYQKRFSLVPGAGRHVLQYRNALVLIERQREKAFDSTGKPFETIRLTTLQAHRSILEDMVAESYALDQQTQEGKTVILKSWGTEWRPFGRPKRKRPLSSVVLAEGLKEKITADIKDFLQARTWYLDQGIPYQRGYLLHGPPGTGKSSFIRALAGDLDYNIAILNVSEPGLHDDRLAYLLENLPPQTLVVLEDIDRAFRNNGITAEASADGYKGATVTFSGLLNAIDGIVEGEERILFFTTNHLERLDGALMRPGRVDMAIRLGEATEWQMGQLWAKFYGGERGEEFAKRVRELGLSGRVSPAKVQGLFQSHKKDPGGALENLESLLGDR